MAHDLKINYNGGSFFFGPQNPNFIGYNTYKYSLDLKNLSEDFVRGMHMVMGDIGNESPFYGVFSLETNVDIEFPMKEIVIKFPEGDTYCQLCSYLDRTIRRGEMSQQNAIDHYYNLNWKFKCDEYSKQSKINIKSRYTARLKSMNERYLIQFDSSEFLSGILTGMSWMNLVSATMTGLESVHEDFKLVKIEYDYQIDVSQSYHEMNEHSWEVLNTLNIIKPLFNIIKSYLPNICKGVERKNLRVAPSGLSLSLAKPNFFDSSNYLKCVTPCRYGFDTCDMCEKNDDVINLDNLYMTKIISINPFD